MRRKGNYVCENSAGHKCLSSFTAAHQDKKTAFSERSSETKKDKMLLIKRFQKIKYVKKYLI